jgi:hypothetical protein
MNGLHLRLLAGITVTALAACGEPAQAEDPPSIPDAVIVSANLASTDPFIAKSLAAAAAHFGRDVTREHCPHGPSVYIAGNYGTAIYGAAELAGCTIWLGGSYYPSPPPDWAGTTRTRGYWRAELCRAVVHEYGHLLGLGHAHGDPVMDPSTTGQATQPVRCPRYPNVDEHVVVSVESATPTPARPAAGRRRRRTAATALRLTRSTNVTSSATTVIRRDGRTSRR